MADQSKEKKPKAPRRVTNTRIDDAGIKSATAHMRGIVNRVNTSLNDVGAVSPATGAGIINATIADLRRLIGQIEDLTLCAPSNDAE